MGSCISKCKPKPTPTPPPNPKQSNLAQDKLVISQPAKDPPIFPSNNSLYSPSSSCTTSVSTSSCSFSKSPLSSTCSSSISTSNYTNEFLWSYGKEDLHYSVKSSPVRPLSVKLSAPVAVPLQSKQLYQPKHGASLVPSKRSRPNSPTLIRQKSFRREPDRSHQVTSSLSQRNLGSSSPRRRFNNDIPETVERPSHNPQRNLVSASPTRRFHSDNSEANRPYSVSNSVRRRNMVSSSPSRRFSKNSEPDRPHSVTNSVPRRNMASSSPSRRFHDNSELDRPHLITNSLPQRNLSSSSPSRRFNGDMGREVPKSQPKGSHNYVPAPICASARNKENMIPWNNAIRDGSSMHKTETCTHKIDPGADKDNKGVGLMVSNQDQDSLPIGDINDPHISLDCFIFL